jgi:invasion protein IalB
VETAAAYTATVEAAAKSATAAVTAAAEPTSAAAVAAATSATTAATRQRGAWLGHCQNRRERGDGNTHTTSDADGLHADLLLHSPPERAAVAEIWRLSPLSVVARG